MKWLREYWFEVALAVAGLLVVGLGVGGFLAGAHLGASESRAQIGDFVGGTTTPILTALTFIGVLVGIALQRRELIETRKELERSAEALENQGAHLGRQQLSQSFFDLFQMYQSVVAELKVGSGDSQVTGKAALSRFSNYFEPGSFYGNKPWNIEDLRETHKRYNDDLGNYFRIIFRILVFLSDKGDDGHFYGDMFRAQLTTAELHLLFFNCASDVGRPMQTFASRFELFDNMPVPSDQSFKGIVDQIDPAGFGKNANLLALMNPREKKPKLDSSN